MANGMTEKQAYKKIAALAETRETPIEEAARLIFMNEGLL